MYPICRADLLFPAWNDMRPLAVDLFAGAGGLGLGFEQAGFDVAAAVEIDPVHCAVHEFNFPRTAIIPQSVEKLDIARFREDSGIGAREIDCVFGGAPCQGFSLIGKRVLEDPRNNLVLEFVRVVAGLNARTFVFENVRGLTIGRQKRFLEELVAAFEQVGYEVRIPWKVLNAGHFGVPQHRERLFLLGCRKGEILPDYPKPRVNIAGKPAGNVELAFGPTCADALGDLPDAERFRLLLESDTVATVVFGSPSTYASEMRCLTDDAWHFGYMRELTPGILTSSTRTGHTEISRRRFRETLPGTVVPVSRFFKLAKNGVCNTLRAGTDGARGAFTSPRPVHYAHARCITVREMARLHGFPDWFRFNATKWHGARQIGNSVPPPLARAVASGVMAALEVMPVQPGEILSLGDVKLLNFNSSTAAEYFGVKARPGRRDRKSGSRKRSQVDIERERIGKRGLAI